MSLRHQRSNLTNETMGGYTHTPRHSFLFRVAWMAIVSIALMAVTICTYQGTESLIGWVNQWSI